MAFCVLTFFKICICDMGLVVFFFLLLHVVKLVFGFQRKLKTVYVTYQNGVSMFKPGDMVSSD